MPFTHESPTHIDEGSEPLVALLKSGDFSSSGQDGSVLPYRLDQLRNEGLRLGWTDAHLHDRCRTLISRIEALTVPFSQALRCRKLRRSAACTLAIFESEGHALALWRRLTRRCQPPLVIMACWLADLAVDGGRVRRALYRWLYGVVDLVVVFSSNQVEPLGSLLGIEPSKVLVVRFGVDLDELAQVHAADGAGVVAVGRDLGRDWATLARAAEGTGWKVDLVTRPAQVAGLVLPSEITVHSWIPRAEYLQRLAGAGVVVVPTEVREYPTGQTVLLEAMALGKACVVTDTPAMREYVDDGRTALLVPPHDATALRDAVNRLLHDDDLRRNLGSAAASTESGHGGSHAMWTRVACAVRSL